MKHSVPEGLHKQLKVFPPPRGGGPVEAMRFPMVFGSRWPISAPAGGPVEAVVGQALSRIATTFPPPRGGGPVEAT